MLRKKPGWGGVSLSEDAGETAPAVELEIAPVGVLAIKTRVADRPRPPSLSLIARVLGIAHAMAGHMDEDILEIGVRDRHGINLFRQGLHQPSD